MGRLLDEEDVIAEIERHKNYVGEKYRQKYGDADGILDLYFKAHDHVIEAIKMKVPSAQPELIEKVAYIRGFEQGRTQGMIDAQGGKK